MVPVHRLSQERDAGGQWKEQEEEESLGGPVSLKKLTMTASRLARVTVTDQAFNFSG
ncbi:MAG: hypothetical protein NTX84_10585 [Nitrospirae bacterium]|nr:hypothetical protein [Nitrospirota bacterium]